jgi:hypothetical protein
MPRLETEYQAGMPKHAPALALCTVILHQGFLPAVLHQGLLPADNLDHMLG